MHKQEMFYHKECRTSHIFSPVKETFCALFQKSPMIFGHMFWYVDWFGRIHFSHMRCYAVVLIENLNAVFSSSDIYFFTDEFIWDRILAIPNSYEIIRLYGGS